jgi:hypothetical protein
MELEHLRHVKSLFEQMDKHRLKYYLLVASVNIENNANKRRVKVFVTRLDSFGVLG